MTFGRGLASLARNQEATAQRVKTRLYLLRAEWFLDVDAGVPYIQRITVKPTDLFYTESIIKKTVLETEGVSEITSFGMDYNRDTRKLLVTMTVTTIYGTTADIRVDI